MTVFHLGSAPKPAIQPARDTVILLPIFGGGAEIKSPIFECGMVRQAHEFAELWKTDPRQRRNEFECDERLTRAAMERVALMIDHNSVSHASGGITANELVRGTGYRLPEWYSQHGNNVESVAGGYQTAAELPDVIWNSPTAHKNHIFGLDDFWLSHTRFGVGFAEMRDGSTDYSTFWAFVSAPAEDV